MDMSNTEIPPHHRKDEVQDRQIQEELPGEQRQAAAGTTPDEER